MTTLNIPVVKSEMTYSKNCRMVIVVGIIVIGLMILLNTHSNYKNDVYIPPYVRMNPVNMECMSSDFIQIKHENVPVKTKTIVLYNLNKRVIPVRQIMVIGTNTKIIYIPRADAKITHPNKIGTNMRFELPYEINVKQVIIDVEQFCNSKPNITTTQVELLDNNNSVVWNNIKPLNVSDRYIYLYIVKPSIIYPTKAQKLCTGLPGSYRCIQENVLNAALQENTWH
jgi:hypothetical protein